MKILVTGGCGFIASHLVDKLLELEHQVQDIDCLTYAADPEIRKHKNYRHIHKKVQEVRARHIDGPIDVILHLAAESHNDAANLDPKKVFDTNVMGTLNMLQLAMELKVKKFIHISTDEVLGELADDASALDVNAPIAPRGVYASSKAAAEHAVRAYQLTYGLPASIIRSCNAYGQRQLPEKLIPRAITKILNGHKVPVFGTGQFKRQWIYVKDLVREILLISETCQPGQTYHVAVGHRIANIEVIRKITSILGAGEIEFVEDRKAHDCGYELVPSTAIKGITNLDNGLEKTIKWYVQNTRWWNKMIDRGCIW